MEIEDVKKEKSILQENISAMLRDFSNRTGVYVTEVNITELVRYPGKHLRDQLKYEYIIDIEAKI